MIKNNSVVKAFMIIEYLANAGGEVPIKKLAKDLRLGSATIYRYLSTLKDMGYVSQNSENLQYRLALKITWIASLVIGQNQKKIIIHTKMDQLSHLTHETVHFCVRDTNRLVYIDKVDTDQTIQMRSTIGAQCYYHSTSVGKAVLAFLPEDEALDILKNITYIDMTHNTIRNELTLQKELEITRLRGYSIDNEENEIGIRCIGAPVFDYTGKVYGAISISGWIISMRPERIDALAVDLLKTSQEISRELGYLPNLDKSP